ncbi:MAG TPA: magnesium transporter MgtE, partial [Polyangia bacterium]
MRMLKSADLDRPVAQLMRGDCTRLSLGTTVGATLEALRHELPGERIIYFYVVDAEGRLKGV